MILGTLVCMAILIAGFYIIDLVFGKSVVRRGTVVGKDFKPAYRSDGDWHPERYLLWITSGDRTFRLEVSKSKYDQNGEVLLNATCGYITKDLYQIQLIDFA